MSQQAWVLKGLSMVALGVKTFVFMSSGTDRFYQGMWRQSWRGRAKRSKNLSRSRGGDETIGSTPRVPLKRKPLGNQGPVQSEAEVLEEEEAESHSWMAFATVCHTCHKPIQDDDLPEIPEEVEVESHSWMAPETACHTCHRPNQDDDLPEAPFVVLHRVMNSPG